MKNITASLDIGTNTARLLIGSVNSGIVDRILVSRAITRLGGGFTLERGISREATERAVIALSDFSKRLREFNICRYRAVATSAVRDAVNRENFCAEILDRTGINLEIISGEDEGVLTLAGVISGLDTVPERSLVFDVGGGSTEYTIAEKDRILFTSSLPLGVVRLTEGKGSPELMAEKIVRELSDLKVRLSSAGQLTSIGIATLIGTAGTATTLAAIDLGLADYDYAKVNNMVLEKNRIHSIYDSLVPLTAQERLEQIIGLERGREDLIIAGALITLLTMEIFGFKSMKVSDFGLLEGVFLSLNKQPESS